MAETRNITNAGGQPIGTLTLPDGQSEPTWAAMISLYSSFMVNYNTQPVVPQIVSADVAASNSAADFTIQTITLPASSLNIGSTIEFTIYGIHSNGTTAGTANFWVKIGATKVLTVAIASTTTTKTNQPWKFEGQMVIRTTGSGGTAFLAGNCVSSITATANGNSISVPTTTSAINTTVANTITTGINWTAANASNSLTTKSGLLNFNK